MDSPHKGSVIRKVCLCRDALMGVCGEFNQPWRSYESDQPHSKHKRQMNAMLTHFEQHLHINISKTQGHDGVIKWKHFPRYWPFVRGIHRTPVNSPHKGQWRGALMFSLVCTRINGWVNNGEAGDFRRHHAHYDVTVMGWDVFKVLMLKNCCFKYAVIWHGSLECICL